MMPKSPHPHVAWRGGRPRFQPSATLRLQGYKGGNLQHADGRWFTFDEAVAWSEQFVRDLGRVSPTPARPVTGVYAEGFIYFLWVGKGIKIGFSKDPFRRVPELKTAIAEPIKMCFFVPGSIGDERRLHQRLKSQRLNGEWFRASVPTLNVMRMVLNEHSTIRGGDQ